jgi:hypothetical protein
VEGEFLAKRRLALEEAFFHKREEEVMAAWRAELERKQTREELRSAAGVTDDAVLDQLVSLGVTGKTVAAMSVVPLVWVAWADGHVEEAERLAVLRAAHERGIEEHGPTHALLARWLSQSPDPRLFDAWTGYIRDLGQRLEPAQRDQLREQIAGFARQVAEAAGGFLGSGTINSEERQALDAITSAF